MDAPARHACEEKVPGEGSVFAVCRRFLPPVEADAALAAEALLRSVADIPDTVSDPGVGVVKLKWWQDAVLEAGADRREADSQHPVIRAAAACGLTGTWGEDAWRDYVAAVTARLDASPFTSAESLLDSLRETAGRSADLLAGIDDDYPRCRAVTASGAATALLELAEAWARAGGQPAWLPLDLVARHGDTAGEGAREALLSQLGALALDALGAAPGRVDRSELRGPTAAYLVLRDRVTRARLKRLRRRPGRFTRRGGLATGDVWAAWRTARRLAGQGASGW